MAKLYINDLYKQLEQCENKNDFQRAILDCSIDRIRFFLTIDDSIINHTDNFNNSPLHYAVICENTECVMLMLMHATNINLNMANRWGKSALHYACELHLSTIIQCLIDHNANINVTDLNEETPLHYAIKYHSMAIFKILMRNCAINVNAEDKIKMTPLHLAVNEFFDINIIKILLQNGANINAKNLFGKTPLYYAVSLKLIAIVEIFLKHPKIEINAYDYNEQTPIFDAVKNSDLIMIELLLQNGADYKWLDAQRHSIFHVAISDRLFRVLPVLFKHLKTMAITINQLQFEIPLLHYAIQENCIDMAEYIIENDEMSLNSLNKYDQTILHVAIIHNFTEIFLLVPNYEKYFNAVDLYGQTPIYYVFKYNRHNIICILLQNNLLKLQENTSILLYAIKYKFDKIIINDILVKCNTNPNNTDSCGMNALHYAIYYSDFIRDTEPNQQYKHIYNLRYTIQIMKILLAHNVDINAQDIDGKSVLYYAVKSCTIKLVVFLLQQGAHILPMNEHIQNVYFNAIEEKHCNAVQNRILQCFCLYITKENNNDLSSIKNEEYVREAQDYFNEIAEMMDTQLKYSLSQELTFFDLLLLRNDDVNIIRNIFFSDSAKKVINDNKFPIYGQFIEEKMLKIVKYHNRTIKI